MLLKLVLTTLSLTLGLLGRVSAEDRMFNWNITWVNANPDGAIIRQIVGINEQWPMPVVHINKGDRVIVNVLNLLPDRNASIHFHGMFQNGTNGHDGPVWTTQCPIPPGGTFTYNFTVNQNGTYWYHSHVEGQYPDGYRQAFVVHDPDFPYEFDEEYTITLSDWYHNTIEAIEPKFLTVYNPTGAEPIPDSFLFNDTLKTNVSVQPNKTYMLRVINIGAFVAQYFHIEDHEFEIVEVDGVYVEPQTADFILLSVAQRYSILVKTKATADKNFPIVTIADSDLLDIIPSSLTLNQTNWLEYNKEADHPLAQIPYDTSADIEYFDDTTLVPYDREPLYTNPTKQVNITVTMNNLDNGVNYAFFNNITYTPPKVPTLYTVMSSGDLASNQAIYGDYTHSYVLEKGEVVEIILNNADGAAHPFHLHGHTFQVLYRSPAYDDDDITPYDPTDSSINFPEFPIRRDTLIAHPNGNFVIRFVADNPGVWLFHCHIEWHLMQGLALQFIEAPKQLQEQVIPADHYVTCKAAGVPWIGNAAANADDFLDLAGQNEQAPFLPDGFTTRGIVALVFSIISAFLGMAAIAWYGLSDLSLTEAKMIQHAEEDAGMEPEDIDPDDVSERGA